MDLHIGCYKHWWAFDLVNACKVKYGLIDELEVDFDDGVQHEEFFDICFTCFRQHVFRFLFN